MKCCYSSADLLRYQSSRLVTPLNLRLAPNRQSRNGKSWEVEIPVIKIWLIFIDLQWKMSCNYMHQLYTCDETNEENCIESFSHVCMVWLSILDKTTKIHFQLSSWEATTLTAHDKTYSTSDWKSFHLFVWFFFMVFCIFCIHPMLTTNIF